MTVSLFAQNAKSTELTDKDVQSFAKYGFYSNKCSRKYAMLCRCIGILTVERNLAAITKAIDYESLME